MTTAVSLKSGSESTRESSVVFPLPRKPVNTESGIGSAGTSLGWTIGPLILDHPVLRSKRHASLSAAMAYLIALVIDGAVAGALYALIALSFVLVYRACSLLNFEVSAW